MNTTRNPLSTSLGAMLLVFGLSACEPEVTPNAPASGSMTPQRKRPKPSPQGPAERAGEKVDEATEEAGEAAEDLGDKAEEETER